MEKPNKKLVLENGEVFYGYAFGAKANAVGQIVFNTAMAGYQEVISDLSYLDQMIVMSYPIIGSYGVTDEDYESKSLGLKALIVREYNDNPSNFRYTKTLAELLEENGVPGLQGVDTRRLISIIRDKGTLAAALVDIDVDDKEAVNIAKAYVYPQDATIKAGCKKRWYSRTPNHKYTVVAIDCGIKFSTIKALNTQGCNLIMVPTNIKPEEIVALKPDGIFFSNGPGSPENAPLAVALAKALIGKFPIMGIGLGMQVLALAKGAKIKDLKCGHHGANHPIKNLQNGKVEVVQESHMHVVDEASLKNTGFEVTHKDLLDKTVMGIEDVKNKAFGLQFFADSKYFKKFADNMKKGE